MVSTLITGDKGYIGSHLSKLIPDFIGCDLKDGKDYRDISGHEFDVVIHLAASVSVTESFDYPDQYLWNNAYGLIEFIKSNTIGKLIFVSTGGALYGDRHEAEEEDARWNNCKSPYAQSKYLAEDIIHLLHPDNHVILRLANVFGGDLSIRGEANVHSHFISDNPITVYGGTQTRDFIHVDGVCHAILKAMTLPVTGTFNIGSGVESSILDLAKTYASYRQVPLEIKPARAGEVEFISLNIEKAKQAGLL